MERHGNFLPPYVSTRITARWLIALILLTAALASVSAGFEISELLSLNEARTTMAADDQVQWAYSRTRSGLFWARVVALVAVAAVFMTWLHRMRINVRAFGCRRFRFPRIWTVAGFFVPIVNFFRPFQVVSEVWRASDPRSIESPMEWKRLPLPQIVLVWWVTLLTAAIFEIVTLLLLSGSEASIARFAFTRGFATIACFGSTGASILAFLVVSQMERLQQTKWAILNHQTDVLNDVFSTRSTATIPPGIATAESN